MAANGKINSVLCPSCSGNKLMLEQMGQTCFLCVALSVFVSRWG